MLTNRDFHIAYGACPSAVKIAGLSFPQIPDKRLFTSTKSSTDTSRKAQTVDVDGRADDQAGCEITRRIRVFLVEDEAIIALDIRRRLQRLGHDVIYVASSAYEAVQQIRQLQPDVVLMDIRLQGKMDGIEAARIVGKSCAMPIIFMTAQTDQATRTRAEALEPAGYLVKPIVIEELNELITSCIRQDS
jgi:CheY-like chemotaxis protein